MIRIKPPIVFALLVAVSIAVTFFFWWEISFARRLDDSALDAALQADASPRKVQHGIVEITERYREGRPGMDRWAERLVGVSRRDERALRGAAAWAMQFAVADPAVDARLRELVTSDGDTTVRRNAACSLSLAKDASDALPVLRSMLEPFTVVTPAPGTVESVAAVGRRPRDAETVGRLRGPGGERIEVVTDVSGRVVEVAAREGDTVAAGARFVVLAPDADHVLAAAKALGLAGDAGDVERIRTLLAPSAAMPPEVVEQARRAIEAIEARARR